MKRGKKRALIEALLFASSKPLSVDVLNKISGLDKKAVRVVLEALVQECEEQLRGFVLEEIAGGYQFRTNPEFAKEVGALFKERSRRRFTPSSLETLAIVAYRQPVPRSEIEYIRGVDCGGVIRTLLLQGMIRILGRKETPGRPILYGTSQGFLEYFGLRDLESLPTLEEISELIEGSEGLSQPDDGQSEQKEKGE